MNQFSKILNQVNYQKSLFAILLSVSNFRKAVVLLNPLEILLVLVLLVTICIRKYSLELSKIKDYKTFICKNLLRNLNVVILFFLQNEIFANIFLLMQYLLVSYVYFDSIILKLNLPINLFFFKYFSITMNTIVSCGFPFPLNYSCGYGENKW